MLERFAIFAPVLGVRQDFPAILLREAMLPQAENVRLEDGEIHRCLMRSEILDDATVAILHYHWLEKSAGTAYLFAFASQTAWLWDEGTTAWVDQLTPALSASTTWSTCTFADQVIATNNVDKVLIGDDATAFDVMGAAGGIAIDAVVNYLTRARFVVTFENYVFFGDTTEAGADYSRRLRWCAIGDITDWATGDSGYVDVGGGDAVTGAVVWGSNLVILKERSIHRLYLTGGDTIFQLEQITDACGCVAPRSAVVGWDGVPIFFATDRTFRAADGRILSEEIDDTLKEIPDAYVGLVCGWRVDEYGELWWAVPVGAGQTTNNKALALSRDGRWTIRNMPVVCFGRYKRLTTTTIDSLVAPLTIDTWDWPSIDWTGEQAGTFQDIGAAGTETFDLHGDTQDDGADFTGYFDLGTDLGPRGQAYQYKRLLNMRVYAKNEHGGTLTVEAQADEDAWHAIGIVNLNGGGAADLVMADLPTDIRARHLRLRFSSQNHFRFLGAVFEFTKDGFQ